MKASTKRILSLMVAVLIIIVAIIIYANFVKPEYDAAQALRGKMAAKLKIYQDQSEAVTKIQQLITKNTSASLGRLSLALPLKESSEDIVDQMQAIAQASGVSISSLSLNYMPVTPGTSLGIIKGYGTLKVLAKISGSYDSFKNFLKSLETNIRVMDVSSLKVSSTGSLVYDLTVNTYYQLSK
ncbi:MAG: hypothetical protein PHP03_00155 [Candidatus Pacebacteria bacterium]|nr:hypothetical protein [Candidatus Paceibacterota bacterium]